MPNEYFETVKPTYIENWPAGLVNHSVATAHFPLAPGQVRALIAFNYMTLEDGRIPTEEEKLALKELEAVVQKYIVQFPKGAFVRLGSRSPKDSWLGHREGFRCTSGAYALKLLRKNL